MLVFLNGLILTIGNGVCVGGCGKHIALSKKDRLVIQLTIIDHFVIMIVSEKAHHINFDYYVGMNLVMASSDPKQKSKIPIPFLNPSLIKDS